MTNSVKAATVFAQTVSDVARADSNADGKVSSQEVLSLVSTVGLRIFTTVPGIDFTAVAGEIRTADTEERQVVLDALHAAFDLVDDELEVLIEDVLDYAEQLYTVAREQIAKGGALVERIRAKQA